jgi:AcrR family transcriptional regulator
LELNNRQKQAKKTKEKIFEVSTSLIEKKGYHNVTVSEICKKANVAKGTFYHHFNSKKDIIVKTYQETDEYFKKIAKNEINDYDSLTQIKEFIRHQIIYAESSSFEYVKEVYKSQIDSGNKFFTSKNRPIFKLLKSYVEKAQREKKLTVDKTADYITDFLLRFSRGMIYDWCLHDGNYKLQARTMEDLEEIISIFKNEND